MSEYFLFSGGEVHCKIGASASYNIVMKDYTMNGFMYLAQQVDVLRRRGIKRIAVTYPYFPYARQDRVLQEDEPFSLRIFTNLLNSLGLDHVTVWDPHSDVTPALINNCRVVPQWDIARTCIPEGLLKDAMFISPDAGAYKKLSKLITDDSRICIGSKTRNKEGKVISTNIYEPGSNSIRGATCVIVDDICDGGSTFIELAKVLKKYNPTCIVLYVTHGIFSKGVDVLKPYIDFIYTTNSFNNTSSKYMSVLELC